MALSKSSASFSLYNSPTILHSSFVGTPAGYSIASNNFPFTLPFPTQTKNRSIYPCALCPASRLNVPYTKIYAGCLIQLRIPPDLLIVDYSFYDFNPSIINQKNIYFLRSVYTHHQRLFDIRRAAGTRSKCDQRRQIAFIFFSCL